MPVSKEQDIVLNIDLNEKTTIYKILLDFLFPVK